MLPSAALALAMLIVPASATPGDSHGEQGETPAGWRHLTMDDLEVDVSGFQPVRGRYFQVMLDLDGNRTSQGNSFVHLELDRALQSGPWDGAYPATLEPFREPGVVIDWKVQNGVYNAYDRVVTDSRMSTIRRDMPAGAHGLLLGVMIGDTHTRLHAPLGGTENTFEVTRRDLPDGFVNVLTVPYVLAAMDLKPGQRFTLPGFAPFGGPDGNGRPWRGAFEVKSVRRRSIRGAAHDIVEVYQWTFDPNAVDREKAEVPPLEPGRRFTRHFVSSQPPYFVGRSDYLMRDDGSSVPIREQINLVDWAPIPLPAAELIEKDVWTGDPATEMFDVKPEHIPTVLVPRTP